MYNWILPIINALCVLVLMAPMSSGAATAVRSDRPPVIHPLPSSKADCSTCHLVTGTRRGGELKKKLSALCLDCHPDRTAPAEHKVDTVPAGEVKGLPLTNGMITCFTCHDPHRNPYGGLLRMNRADLCLACHPV